MSVVDDGETFWYPPGTFSPCHRTNLGVEVDYKYATWFELNQIRLVLEELVKVLKEKKDGV